MNRQPTPKGVTPAIVLEDPKFARNVGFVLRSAYNFGMEQLWVTGDRIDFDGRKGQPLPREERFKEYARVPTIRSERPIDRFPRGTTVIGVELVPGAMPLTYFEHPDNAVYVFGKEDGGISKGMRTMVHQFVFISTHSCLNLAMAVSVVLYDRLYKAQIKGDIPVQSLEETLNRYQSNHEQEMLDVFDPV